MLESVRRSAHSTTNNLLQFRVQQARVRVQYPVSSLFPLPNPVGYEDIVNHYYPDLRFASAFVIY